MLRRFSTFLPRIVVFALAVNILCHAQSQLLTRHVREAVVNGQAQLIGQLPATETLRFDIVLPLRDRAGLQNFVQEVQDPASASYHQFLTPQEVTARFGPSQANWDALVAFAKASGFDIVGGTRDGRDLQLTGTVANIEKAFHVNMGLYRDPTEDRTFFAIDREPTVDLPFQLWHITGLDNDSRPHPLYVKKSDYAKAHGIDPDKVVSNATTGSGPSASFLGSDMRAAYYGGTALTGTGQTLALFEFLGTDLADLTTYYNNVGQTKPYTPTLIST
ncbi:MAG: protease pro-enzyme activation domain-containing protein, partial [Candidatus Sulfotelmatobacter sp.]